MPHLLPLQDSWASRTLKCTFVTQFGTNRAEQSPTLTQPGGVMVTVGSRLSSRLLDQGADDLGWWSWIHVGTSQHSTVILSAYRPCKTYGATTVYIQHKRARSGDALISDPRTQFFTDLIPLINNFHDIGANVIVGVELNENVLSSKIQTFLVECRLWNPVVEVSSLHYMSELLYLLRGRYIVHPWVTSEALWILCGW